MEMTPSAKKMKLRNVVNIERKSRQFKIDQDDYSVIRALLVKNGCSDPHDRRVQWDVDGYFRVRGLNIRGLSTLPEEIGNLASLEELNLSNMEITALPSSIGKLQNLKKLDLSSTRLSALPEEIGNLTSLETLYLSSTYITALPSSIGKLQNLKKLNLSSTILSALPDEIGNLASLEQLYLSSTHITALPSSIGKLQNLKKLDLSFTRLSALPDEIGNLASLETLDLRGRNIFTFPPSIACALMLNSNKARIKISTLQHTPGLWPYMLENATRAYFSDSISVRGLDKSFFHVSKADAIHHLLILRRNFFVETIIGRLSSNTGHEN